MSGILLDLIDVPTTILCLMLPGEAKRLDSSGLEALSHTDSPPCTVGSLNGVLPPLKNRVMLRKKKTAGKELQKD